MTVPPGGPPKAVIDSSVLVPILIYQCPSANWLVGLWKSQRIILLARQDTLEELSAKLKEKAPTTREYPAQRFAPAALRQYAPLVRDNTAQGQHRTPGMLRREGPEIHRPSIRRRGGLPDHA